MTHQVTATEEVDAETAQSTDVELQGATLRAGGAQCQGRAHLIAGVAVAVVVALATLSVAAVVGLKAHPQSVDASFQQASMQASERRGPPLCAPALVQETCSEFPDASETAAFVTMNQITEELSATKKSVKRLWDRLDLPKSIGEYKTSCARLCDAITEFVKENGVLPPSSDVACYNVDMDTFCDAYVGPDELGKFGAQQGRDIPNYHDKEVMDELGEARLLEGVAVGNQTGARMLGTALAEKTRGGIETGLWETAERVANLFRIFPAKKPKLQELEEEEELEEPQGRRLTGKPGVWPPGGKAVTMKKEAEAKAYMAHAIAAFNQKGTKEQMDKWFGEKAFESPSARKKVLKTMNSVAHMINNVHYVPNGKDCSEWTYAYVFPEWNDCNKKFANKGKPCTKTKKGDYVFYLCNYYFQTPDEMIETLVHEGSHHATAYTDDVSFQGDTAYGREACMQLAKKNMKKSLKNADNFCYYIQDVADFVPGVER